MAEQTEIRGLMIPVTNGRVLLPNASVAEVITLSTPEKVPNAPEWLMGRINWRGWRVRMKSRRCCACWTKWSLARRCGQVRRPI